MSGNSTPRGRCLDFLPAYAESAGVAMFAEQSPLATIPITSGAVTFDPLPQSSWRGNVEGRYMALAIRHTPLNIGEQVPLLAAGLAHQ